MSWKMTPMRWRVCETKIRTTLEESLGVAAGKGMIYLDKNMVREKLDLALISVVRRVNAPNAIGIRTFRMKARSEA